MDPHGNRPRQVLNLQLGDDVPVSSYSQVPGTVLQADVTHLPQPKYPTYIPSSQTQAAPVHPYSIPAPQYNLPSVTGATISNQPRALAVGKGMELIAPAGSGSPLGSVTVQPSFAEDTGAEKSKQTDAEEGDDKKKDDEYHRKVSFYELFRYTSACDRILMFFAIICSMGNGGTSQSNCQIVLPHVSKVFTVW
jgi:hypothetical protein